MMSVKIMWMCASILLLTTLTIPFFVKPSEVEVYSMNAEEIEATGQFPIIIFDSNGRAIQSGWIPSLSVKEMRSPS